MKIIASLEELGLHEKASIVQQVLDDPYLFEKIYQSLDGEDLNYSKSYIEEAFASPELFKKAYQYVKEFGLNQAKYIKLLLNDFGEFKQSCEYLDECQLGQSVSYIKEIIVNSALFTQAYELMALP